MQAQARPRQLEKHMAAWQGHFLSGLENLSEYAIKYRFLSLHVAQGWTFAQEAVHCMCD